MKKQLMTAFENLINPFKRNKEVNKAFTQANYDNFSLINDYHITDIVARKEKNVLRVQISTNSPGALIGKGGKNIKRIQCGMQDMLTKSIKIDVKESDLWK